MTYRQIKSEWFLAAALVLCTTVLTLLTIRWLAPQLLGIPVDLQLVQSSKIVPPFFDGVFRDKDYLGDTLIIKDPVTNIRFRPSLQESKEAGTGPHDILGFRNRSIPNLPDVIAIGDSQTYGLGEPINNTWPSQLVTLLGETNTTIYSMAVGGWGAAQYLHMAALAAKRRPQALVIAFYSGNDALESFSTVYGNKHWSYLQPDNTLDKSDAPAIGNMLDVENSWPVNFHDGGSIVFTPVGRLATNDDHPAVRVGYAIMADVARRITTLAAAQNIAVVFTVIPTRELVYANKVTDEGLSPPKHYHNLVSMERKNIDLLSSNIQAISGAHYVDLVAPLQSAALGADLLYPRKWDGHPGFLGYHVIAETIAPLLSEILAR